MKSIKQRLEEDYILGCIRYKNEHQFFIMPVAWWVLDYPKYSPSILIQDIYNFRNGVYIVKDNRIVDYLNSIAEDKISLSEVKNIMENFDEEYSRITFFIDFDNKQFINGFFDIEIEEYLPDEGWTGKFDYEPINYISKDVLEF